MHMAGQHMKRKAQECNKIKSEITIINHFSRLTHPLLCVYRGYCVAHSDTENSHEELISSRLSAFFFEGSEAKLN
jgi:hypothetical protein